MSDRGVISGCARLWRAVLISFCCTGEGEGGGVSPAFFLFFPFLRCSVNRPPSLSLVKQELSRSSATKLGQFASTKGSHSLCTATLEGRVEVFGGGQLVLFALLYLERNQEIEVGNTLFASNSHIRWLGMARQWQ